MATATDILHDGNPDRRVDLLTKMILSIFRLNSNFLQRGNEMLKGFDVDSTSWQVLGALALSRLPMTAPAVADDMGMSRQGAQKRLNKLKDEGYVDHRHNPRHERSPIWFLTPKGGETFLRIMKLYQAWMRIMLEEAEFRQSDLEQAASFLERIEAALQSVPVTAEASKTK